MSATTTRRFRYWRSAAAALALGAAAAGCSSNPATGDSDLIFMSKSDERQIGAENHPKILQQFGGAYDDAALQSYVNSIGQQLAKSSEMPDAQWTFTLLNSDVTNAFALPGGYVYITRGLLALAENESQLAAVIGHEIGHVTARHGAQRHAQGTVAQIGAVGLSILGAVFGGPDVGRAAGQVASVGAQAYVASYSRDQEFEADTLGIRYNGRIGYDPNGMAGFLAKLEEEKNLAAKLRGQAPSGFSYFDTHPPTPDRVARARNLAARTKTSNKEVGRDAYLAKIDGMIWGDSPDQGYARDGVFAHPSLNIRYEVPDNFTLFNAPTKVVAYGPGGAAIVFEGGPKNFQGAMRDYLAQTWGSQTRLSNLQTTQVNGLEAATASARGSVSGRTVDLRIAAIRGEDGSTFQLTLISPSASTSTAAPAFESTLASFRHLTASERRDLKPLRIRLYTIRQGDTIESVARREMGVRKFAVERFVLLNGLTADKTLVPGQTVKIVREDGPGRT